MKNWQSRLMILNILALATPASEFERLVKNPWQGWWMLVMIIMFLFIYGDEE